MGASAIRLVVAEAKPGGGTRVLEELSRGVQLGRDAFSSGTIRSSTIEATLGALEGFAEVLRAYGVERIRAIATSAIREARNREVVLDRIQARTGFAFEIINEAEENRLLFLAVRNSLGARRIGVARSVLVEVGGGSTNVTLLHRGLPSRAAVYPLGSIRLKQQLNLHGQGHDVQLVLLKHSIARVIEEIRLDIPLGGIRRLIAVGGDMRFAASHIAEAQGLASTTAIPRDTFNAFCDEIEHLDEDQLVERFRLTAVEADGLVPALLVYRTLLAETAAPQLTVCDASLRAGALLDFVADEGREELKDYEGQVLTSAESIGHRYRFDRSHGRHVARLATRLFDELQREHGLSGRERLLLQVAALLHDVGIYVSPRAHHKHSQYLLMSSQIFGLSDEERNIVANIARYHRRGKPDPTHLPYIALDRSDRLDRRQAVGLAESRQRARRRTPAEGARAAGAPPQGAVDCRTDRIQRHDDGAAGGDGARRRVRRHVRSPADRQSRTRDRMMAPAVNPRVVFANRELSWMRFNERVLDEAADPTTPLLERVKFAAITASNLDEFFVVRVASLKHAVDEGDTMPDPSGMTPIQQLHAVTDRARALVARQYKLVLEELLPSLATHGIRIVEYGSLAEGQRESLAAFFRTGLLPVLTPLAIDVSRPFPLLASLSVNLALLLAAAPGESEHRLAVVQVPPSFARLVRVPGGDGVSYVLLEQVIRAHLGELFSGQRIVDSAVFRLSRDAELEFDDEGGRSQLEVVEHELRRRRRNNVVRLEVEAAASEELVAFLARQVDASAEDIYCVPGPLDLRVLMPLTEI